MQSTPLTREYEHRVTRRQFLRVGAAGLIGAGISSLTTGEATQASSAAEISAQPEYLTREEDFQNVGRGSPPPHELPLEKRRAVGLLRETWQLEVISDPESDAKIERPLSKDQGTALTWPGLMELAEKRAVRFLAVISCTNMPKPLGMGLWEGVPLREVVWLTGPKTNVRRVFYYGYHNDDPRQRFQSSLTIDRVFEDPPDELPVILCYKLNGQWLTPKRGGPVRMIVPGFYGNKSVKWLQRVILTNNPRLNDTYAEWNNDTESPLKTYASFRTASEKVKDGQTVFISGSAQIGRSGLATVQYRLDPEDRHLPADDPFFTNGDWKDAEILPPPGHWGGGLPNGKLPPTPLQFDTSTGKPRGWPLPNTLVYWGTTLSHLPPGKYDLRCRTIDARGYAQPMPRPFPKSGSNAIQRISLEVEA
jgi:hypothetical protein